MRKVRILYAEDERGLSEAVQDILSYHKYTVDVVENGADALDYALLQHYDCIIFDIMMPVMDGLEALRRLVHTLMDNAVQYGQKGEQIEIALTSTRRRILLTITNPVDTLPACPPQMLFERFYRAGGAKKQNEAGWGVGLSAAESVVQLHQGKCQITYPDEHTFRMSVMLPCGK